MALSPLLTHQQEAYKLREFSIPTKCVLRTCVDLIGEMNDTTSRHILAATIDAYFSTCVRAELDAARVTVHRDLCGDVKEMLLLAGYQILEERGDGYKVKLT